MTKTMRGASFLLATFGFGALNVSVVIAAGDLDRGKIIATQGNGAGALACVACHGPDGKGNDAAGFPSIAGLNAEYLGKQLHDYAGGLRKNAIMQPFAKALTEDDIQSVTVYYQSLKPMVFSITQQAPAEDNQGEWLAMRGDWNNDIPACNQCHGPNGMGVGSSFPALLGQHAGYLKTQLNAWRSGSRDNDPNHLMRGIAQRLSEQQISAVTEYYATLPEPLAAQSKQEESR
ncbi:MULTISPECIES: c-type cytochrome [unclassified Marinobacter]|uniref:c-type cytochrome n=1 Tax=unclassified Marinobacter TaxID=83889 RepID=UPI00200D462C|nr:MULTISPECIES: c-type cytochrome [unclassified Marinobacter]UQG57707.1 cytochrome c4 [Marinobacter sp. M4C]UQG66512.1 cytochrome c4 [Marinobacter sp. M2C]UQG70792.1 cytochrome c4 [Marinobacter sp. M1C]